MLSSLFNLIKGYIIKTLENGIVLRLNINDFTAEIIKSPNAKGDIFIPSTVMHGTQKYIITSIDQSSFFPNFKIKSIKFSQYSEIKQLNFDENFSCGIISLPTNFEKIEFNTFSFLYFLKKLCRFPNHPNFSFLDKDHELIVSNYNKNHFDLKHLNFSTNNCENDEKYFDNLFFAHRQITKAFIDKTIKYIDDYCFADCHNISKIEFKEPSSVISFGHNIFYNSSIEEFVIPSSVEVFKEHWCFNAQKLTKVDVSHNNKYLKTLEENPKIIIRRPKNEMIYNCILFANRDIKKATIPSYITIIAPFSFSDCVNLNSIEFEHNSKLCLIQKGAFCCSSIQFISIPDNVLTIEDDAFSGCSYLKTVEFGEKSKLSLLGKNTFNGSGIRYLIVPRSIKNFDCNSFSFCEDLRFVEFLADEITFSDYCFGFSSNVSIISFPYAKQINVFKSGIFKSNIKIYADHNSHFKLDI